MTISKSKLFLSISILLLACLWVFSVYMYNKLPKTIPIHFDATGNADNYGDKITLFMLPVMASGLFALFTYLIKNPVKANYPVALNEQNSAWQFSQAIALMGTLRINILIVFLMIEGYTYFSIKCPENRLGIIVLPSILMLILLPSGYYIYRMLAGPFRKK